MPGMAAFIVAIAVMGFVNLMFQAMANSYVQLVTDPELRGRVMGLYMLVFIGGTPFGAPVVGAVTSHFGARAGMFFCGVIPAAAAVIMAVAVARRTRKEQRARPVPDDWAELETLLGETTLQEEATLQEHV
jgi:MFS family permease